MLDQPDSVSLRPLEEVDIADVYLGWFRDPEVLKHLEVRDLTRDAALAHLRHGRKTREWFQYAVCLRDSGRMVGACKLGPIKWQHGLSDLSTIIGERDLWGRGIGAAAVRCATDIAFTTYNLRKLSAGMYGLNVASHRAYLRAGWFEEARLKDHFVCDGAVTDRVVMSCFNPRFADRSSADRL